MTDITQKLIAESDGLYYTFFNSMNEGLAICEIILAKNGEPDDYRHLDVNPAFEKIIGIPASRIRGKNQREFGYADPFWLELFGEVLKTGIPLSREDYSSGLGKWFDLRAFSLGGKKFGFQLMDVTERKRMEEALQASETRLKGIFEFSPIGIELYDSNGKITFQERITKWLNGEKPDPNVEYKVRVKDGHEVCVLLNVTFATDEDGNPIRATVVCYDITERKKMEEELAFQGRLLASVHDAISAADENYIITYWNDMAEKIFGWTAQETMGQSSQKIFRTVVPNSSREEAINQMLKDDYYTGEVIYHHKDGTEIYTSVHAKVLRGLNGEFKGNITSFRDITERKKTEEALRQNENKFRLLAENVSDVIWVLNLTLGKFTYISPSVYQLRGYSPEEAMQQSIQESLTPESAQTVFENIPIRIKNSAEAPVHHEVYTDQLRQPCKDGKIIWIETTTKYQYNSAGEIEVVGVSRDITKRKQLEEQLYTTARLTEQRANELDGIISSVAGGLVIYDITGQIIRMNEFAQKIFNYVQDDYLNPFQERIVNLKMYKSDGTAYKTEERPLYRALLGEIIRDEEVLFYRDGKGIWISASLAPIRDGNDHLTVVVFTFIDITKRKRQADEILASEREFLKVTLNSLAEGVLAADQDGKVILINKASDYGLDHSRRDGGTGDDWLSAGI